jgi:hypothetical protein
MKANFWVVAVLFGFLVLVLSIGNVWNNPVSAQAPGAGAVLRYQISAYGGTTPNGSVHHGCYIVDTTTGQVWHTRAGGAAERVSGQLP